MSYLTVQICFYIKSTLTFPRFHQTLVSTVLSELLETHIFVHKYEH